jgi:hypothetical protein
MLSLASREGRVRRRVIDYLLYIAIGSLFIAIAIFVALRWSDDAYTRWFGFICCTFLLFGSFLQNSSKFLRVRQFWVITALSLLVHVLLFVAVLTQVAEWRLMWFGVMVFEYPVLLFLRDKCAPNRRAVE